MTYALSILLRDERVVINIDGDTWRVWYPLDKPIDLQATNQILDFFGLEFKERVLDHFDPSSSDSSQDFDNSGLNEKDFTALTEMLPHLKKRLSQPVSRPIEYAIVLDDD